MFENFREIAETVPLKVWKDPQGNPLLISSENILDVYFGCWDDAGMPADYICKITFNFGWASRSYGIENLPYEIKEFSRSSIYEVINSKWLTESSERRLQCYPEWKTWDKKTYHHFVVSGHNNYAEVLAESFSEEIIPIENAKELLQWLYQEIVSE
jgi:hypothetical protein